jgi:hypothetical protein
LGKWTTIESKEQPGLWHAFLAQEIAAVSYFWIGAPLNGIQTGYTLFHLYPGRSSLRFPLGHTDGRRRKSMLMLHMLENLSPIPQKHEQYQYGNNDSDEWK